LHAISALSEVRASLEDLRLEMCGALDSLEPVGTLRGLRFLEIGDCGEVPSATQLAQLTALEALYAWGSTRFIDGDLTPLAKLPALGEIRMQDRHHYRPRVQELVSAISRRR
jgi:hypothetical protein